MRKGVLTYWIGIVVFCMRLGVLIGQEGDAGRESPFTIGVGARALGLGNAGVAFPDDPSAFIWNPAGMVVVEEKRAGLSLTTLFEGTQYNFVGFVYPTMDAGTFGIGISRIGTGGIKYTKIVDGAPFDTGEEMDYWWGKLTLSYAMTFLKGLSVGFNLNVNRQSLWLYSTSGFGVDFGIHYLFPSERGILRNLFLGGMIENGISPRMKLGIKTETIPYVVKTGIAKYFLFRNDRDRWLFLADIEQGLQKHHQYHIGTEYCWDKTVFLRVGFDDGEFNFGGGLRYHNLQIDYGTSRIGDPEFFPRSHQFSLVFYIGKGVPEKKQLLEEQRQMEIQTSIDQRIEQDRQQRIAKERESGKKYMEEGDYFNARLAFSRILQLDGENAEAGELLASVIKKDQELQQRRQEELLKQGRAEEKLERDNAFINERLTEAMEASEKRDFRIAIDNFEQALEIDPENPQIRKYLEQAKAESKNEVNKLIASSDQYYRQGDYTNAYKMLDRAMEQTAGDPNLQSEVQRRVSNLDNYIYFRTNSQQGQRSYAEGNYETAVRYLQKALEYEPNDERTKELYQNALARSQPASSELEGEALEKYRRGLELAREGLFKDALGVWEEALELAPHNVRLLNAIEDVKKKIELYE